MRHPSSPLESAGFLMADGSPFRSSLSAYDAASHGRRLAPWRPSSAGPNAIVSGSGNTLRARSRDAGRNNAWLKRGLDNWVSNEAGTGIVPKSKAPDPEFARKADALWELWVNEADADGVLNVYGLMALAVRGRNESGEAFIRQRSRRLDDGLVVPLQIQLLEADQVPLEKCEEAEGRRTVQGVVFNRIGQRVSYWMYRRHPGEYGLGAGMAELIEVPASQVVHHYAPLRAGQVRGMPWNVQALIRTRDFDEYDDAELQRKKARAHFTGAIERDPVGDDARYDPLTGAPLSVDATGAGLLNLEPGSFAALLPGEKIQLFSGDEGSATYADYCRQQLLAAAAAINVPYEILSGDMRNVNDRILRAILNEYHRIIEQSQWLYTIPQMCQRIWGWFIDAAVLSGKLSATDYAERQAEYKAAEWRPQGWASMHPVQDAQAKLMRVAGGLSSRSREVAQEGYSVEDVDRENASDAARAQELGLVYSHDAGNPAQD